jgi:heme O synthase-like polyprenyltransferase
MEFFFERLLEASRARWWQVLASVIICSTLAFFAALGEPGARPHLAAYTLGGGVLGTLAAVILLWVDAGQRAREARHDHRLTLRERFMVACLVFGFALGALSLCCAMLMGVIRAIEFFRRG